ncbi:MAG: hypothetical protein ACOX7N_06895 [Lawsonibacter sp.]|jgi:hypothetical protein
MIKHLTFKQQWWLAFGIVLCSFVFSTLFKQGIFSNIGWILAGLLFVIHPVCPEGAKWRYKDREKEMKRDFRVGGVIIIIIGLITRFGV